MLKKIKNLERLGMIRFAEVEPGTRGEWNGAEIVLPSAYARDPEYVASELVHEATHAVDADEHPDTTQESVDEEERTNLNQLDFYEERRSAVYRDCELEERRQARAEGRLRENIRDRYRSPGYEMPEHRPQHQGGAP